MTAHNEQHGWVKFAERWPTETDCDIYGNVEIAGAGFRAFRTLDSIADSTYNLKRTSWWRTPAPLPFITG